MLLQEVGEGRIIMRSGLRLVACMMQEVGVAVGLAVVIVRLWRRMRRGRATSTTILEVAMPEAVEGLGVVYRADPGEAAVCLVVRGWDGEDI